MKTNEIHNEALFREFLKYIQQIVAYYKGRNEYISRNEIIDDNISEDLYVLSSKIDNESLYLGIIGEFSSGKTTFINSMINHNLLATDAKQGTTTVTSIIKYADKNDLEIFLYGGRVIRYSETPSKMDKYFIECGINKKLYQTNKAYPLRWLSEFFRVIKHNSVPKIHIVSGLKSVMSKVIQFIRRNESAEMQSFSYQRSSFISDIKSWWAEFVLWIKNYTFKVKNINVLPASCQKELLCQLFKSITSNDKMSAKIRYVTLFQTEAEIPHDIAIVDTPGTDSLNSRHDLITQNAIDTICDTIIVVIPQGKPVSQELINYINKNLAPYKNDCIFVITKIELLSDQDELPELLNSIKSRLQKYTDIDSPCIVPMPTFLHLKEVDDGMTKNIPALENLTEEEKLSLLNLYDKGLCTIRDRIMHNKTQYIQSKLILLFQRVYTRLSNNLLLSISNYEKQRTELDIASVTDPSDYLSYKLAEIDEFVRSYDPKDVSPNIREDKSYLMQLGESFDNLISDIDECDSSEKIRDKIKSYSCLSPIEEFFSNIKEYLEKIKNTCNKELQNIQRNFYQTYRQCGVNYYVQIEETQASYSKNKITRCTHELEDDFHKKIGEIDLKIFNETNGAWKKIKSFFKNPTQQHKEYAQTELYNELEKITENIQTFSDELITEYLRQIKTDMSQSVNQLIENEKGKIEEYSDKMKRQIAINESELKQAREYKDILDGYMNKIREVL